MDEVGHEVPRTMDEMIGVTLHSGDVDETPARVEKVRIRSGMNELAFIVERKPESVEIDPEILRIDRNRLDNVWRVESGP